MSPTVYREGPFRFYFWSNEAGRPHVHCENGEKNAKYWLEKSGKPNIELEMKETWGFSKQELSQIREIISTHHHDFLKKWYDFFQRPYPDYL